MLAVYVWDTGVRYTAFLGKCKDAKCSFAENMHKLIIDKINDSSVSI
jgi:hypothetical protein